MSSSSSSSSMSWTPIVPSSSSISSSSESTSISSSSFSVTGSNACTESAIRGLLADVLALEAYRDILERQVYEWVNDALGFDLDSLSTPDRVTDELARMTPNYIGCDTTSFPPLNDYINNCFFKQKSEMIRKQKNLNYDLVSIISGLVNLAETAIMQGLQGILAVFEKFSLDKFISSIDWNINCITSSSPDEWMLAQIDDINSRVDSVVNDLPITDSGEFDFDKLTTSLDPGLKANLETYKTRSEEVVTQSRINLQQTIAEYPSDLNPVGRF